MTNVAYFLIIAIAAALSLALRHFVLESYGNSIPDAVGNLSQETTQEKVNDMLFRTGKLLRPDDVAETRLRTMLTQAGMTVDPITWRGIQAVCAIASFGLSLWIAALFKLELNVMPLATIICLTLGFSGPSFYLKSKKKARQNSISGALPSSLELLNTAVRSGYPIERGIRLVAINTEGALSDEFKRVDKEITLLGMPLEVALERMKQRCDTQSVTTFCNSLIHARKQGTSITRALNAQAKSVRNQHYTDLLVKINQLPNKMVPVIFVVFFPIIIALSVVPIAYNAAMTLTSLM